MSQQFGHTLAAARTLAASGDYATATAMLEGLDAPELAIQARLLRAKIMAQQARFDDAISEWEQVLATEPQNQEALEGLAMARRLRQRRAGKVLLRARLYVALLLVTGLAALVIAVQAKRRAPSPAEKSLQATLLAQSEATRNEISKLRQDNTLLSAAVAQTTNLLLTQNDATQNEIGKLRQENKLLSAALAQTTNLLQETRFQHAEQMALKETTHQRILEQVRQEQRVLAIALTNTTQYLQAAVHTATTDLATLQRAMERLAERAAVLETNGNNLREQLAAFTEQAARDRTAARAEVATLVRELNLLNRELLADKLTKLNAERDWLRALERAYRAEPRRHLENAQAQKRRERLRTLEQEIEALRARERRLHSAAEEALHGVPGELIAPPK